MSRTGLCTVMVGDVVPELQKRKGMRLWWLWSRMVSYFPDGFSELASVNSGCFDSTLVRHILVALVYLCTCTIITTAFESNDSRAKVTKSAEE